MQRRWGIERKRALLSRRRLNLLISWRTFVQRRHKLGCQMPLGKVSDLPLKK